MKGFKFSKMLLQTWKIAVGSSMAIFAASLLELQYETSAGIIALLTIVTTKRETVRLAFARFLSLVMSVLIAVIMFQIIHVQWFAFGVYIFLIVLICDILDWKATISVNAVVGTHFLATQSFASEFIENEFLLVLIGSGIAMVLNLFHGNQWERNLIVKKMRYTEQKLQIILGELAAYLDNRDMQRNVWDDICSLEEELQDFVWIAYDYQENTFYGHTGYYTEYFKMRQSQCQMLHNLHYEMKRIRYMPVQAKIISEYMLYLMDYVIEMNDPAEQIEKLRELNKRMSREELPKTPEELESRALLYHILSDLEEFLIFKARFVSKIEGRQRNKYWKKN